jgi:hypothetical protein
MCRKLSSRNRGMAITQSVWPEVGYVRERGVLGVKEQDETVSPPVCPAASAGAGDGPRSPRSSPRVRRASMALVRTPAGGTPRDREPLFSRSCSCRSHRTRLSKISAPPPGRESIPAALLPDRPGSTCRRRAIQSIDHRERFRVHRREPRFQSLQQPGVVVEGPGQVQAADDVELRDRLAVPLPASSTHSPVAIS